MIPERLAQARSFGCETIDIKKGPIPDQIRQILGTPEVDCAVDCVGFEARGWGSSRPACRPARPVVLRAARSIARALRRPCCAQARGCGHDHSNEKPAQVLNDCMSITRAGGSIGIPGLYVPEDPGAHDAAAKTGTLSMRFGIVRTTPLAFRRTLLVPR